MRLLLKRRNVRFDVFPFNTIARKEKQLVDRQLFGMEN